MYPTLAKDERTNNDGSKNERREGFVYIQKRLTPFPPFKAPSTERERHTSLAWDGFWHRLGQFFKAPEPAGTKITARLSACLEQN